MRQHPPTSSFFFRPSPTEDDPLLPLHEERSPSAFGQAKRTTATAAAAVGRGWFFFLVAFVASVLAVSVLLLVGWYGGSSSSSPDNYATSWMMDPITHPFQGGHGFKKPFEDVWEDTKTQRKKGWVVVQHDDTVEYDDDHV
jgi:hypothetical protein